MERIRNYIYYLLGIKDYTEQEIINKVYGQFEKEDIDEKELQNILSYLKENKYIDDVSYVKGYISNKYNSGYGWNRIKQDLTFKKGLKESMFIYLKEEFDWYERAKDLKNSRFGEKKEEDYKKKNKQKNYLLRRGFSMDEVNYAFE